MGELVNSMRHGRSNIVVGGARARIRPIRSMRLSERMVQGSLNWMRAGARLQQAGAKVPRYRDPGDRPGRTIFARHIAGCGAMVAHLWRSCTVAVAQASFPLDVSMNRFERSGH